jgi:hypothetical protein
MNGFEWLNLFSTDWGAGNANPLGSSDSDSNSIAGPARGSHVSPIKVLQKASAVV